MVLVQSEEQVDEKSNVRPHTALLPNTTKKLLLSSCFRARNEEFAPEHSKRVVIPTTICFALEVNANSSVHLCKLFLDDKAGGHGGLCPEWFLKTLGALRIQVPPRGTGLARPADRPGANQKLKQILAEKMNDWEVQKKLEEHFCAEIGTSLTFKVRSYLSEFLSDARATMNRDHKAMIRQTFTETCWPECQPHSQLANFLAFYPEQEEEPEQKEQKKRHECPKGCGETFADKNSKSYKKHEKTCWFQRQQLTCPVTSVSEANLNAPWTPGLVADVVQKSLGLLALRISEQW